MVILGVLVLIPCRSIRAEPDGGRRVDYYSVRRNYSTVSERPGVFMETGLLEKDRKLALESADKLTKTLASVMATLPDKARQELGGVRFYLLWGEASDQGGLPSGMRYVRRGEPSAKNGHDPRWENAIIIYSAKNLMFLDDLWTRKALLHELAHAWHVNHWPDRHGPILQAWNNAMQSGLYRNVRDYKGRVIFSAYARKNQLEYFAELSAAWFVGINYHPFSREELERYDPEGCRMIRELWELR